MWSMWNAPSDRDYYGTGDEPDELEFCPNCGARCDEACEQNCSLVTEEDLEDFAASSWEGIRNPEVPKVA
jgi:hypothetical protein